MLVNIYSLSYLSEKNCVVKDLQCQCLFLAVDTALMNLIPTPLLGNCASFFQLKHPRFYRPAEVLHYHWAHGLIMADHTSI